MTKLHSKNHTTMKKNIWIILFLFALTASVGAQSLDEIVARHVKALGGKDAMSKVTSMTVEQTIEVMGTEAPSVTTILFGKGARTEMEVMGNKIIQVITDSGGWTINPMMGGTEPQPMPEDQYKMNRDQIFPGDALVNYQQKGNKLELVGREQVGSVNAYKLKLTDPSNREMFLYLDPDSWQIIQTVTKGDMMGQPVDITITMSDFRKTDAGLTMPFSTFMDFGGQFSMAQKITKVAFNQPVDTTIFKVK